MKFSGRWAAGYVRHIILPDFRVFADVVTKRLLPTFDSFGTEALRHGDDWFRAKAGHLGPLDDESYLADQALDETLSFADMLVSMCFASIGLYCVGLFHLYEQHMADLPLQLLEAHTYSAEIKPMDVRAWLKVEALVDVEGFTSWPVIQELRLVANTMKHAEGGSAAALLQSRPELFVRPSRREGSKVHDPGHSRIRKPMFGEDLYLTPSDFSRYAEGIQTFWSELAEAMAQHP